MLIKNLDVSVDKTTWGEKTIPSAFNAAPSLHPVDIAAALNMLGALTLPGLVSPASPALTWAWLRYFLSIAGNNNFRITRDFSELDPHQKGILSDDLGVAISTQWLFDRLGGFKSIIDGRLFLVQFPHLLLSQKKAGTAKVGPGKAPDYVVLDRNNRWHVLECKGTQSGAGFRDSVLDNAISQKNVILINGRIAGERIATGLSISHEDQRLNSSLRVIDPESDPALTLGPDDEGELNAGAHRLSAARALGVVGLSEAALELSLPPGAVDVSDYLDRVERRRVRQKASDRSSRVTQQLGERELANIQFQHRKYEGRIFEFEFPRVHSSVPFNAVKVRQGVSHDLLLELSSLPKFFDDDFNRRLGPRFSDSIIESESDGAKTTITDGETFFSELVFITK